MKGYKLKTNISLSIYSIIPRKSDDLVISIPIIRAVRRVQCDSPVVLRAVISAMQLCER